MLILEDTIVAPASPSGIGAVSLVRVSGKQAFVISNHLFPNFNLNNIKYRYQYFAKLIDPFQNNLLDEVLVCLFQSPNSYTGEDVVEIACHGSPFIVNQVVGLLQRLGARPAEPGEFSLRAFINQKLDLAQAEAVADLIAANSAAAHKIAIQQLKGGFSNRLKELRERLLNLAALLELELDFSEEDVEFADRSSLIQTVLETKKEISKLINGFSAGNAIKEGIPTVIIGKPNAGKSTLLNAFLNEERAIVSHIPGTTRDIIEESWQIGGYRFRLIDTAGLRNSTDPIEQEGIRRTYQKTENAALILCVFDVTENTFEESIDYFNNLNLPTTAHYIFIANKIDKNSTLSLPAHIIPISAKEYIGVENLTNKLLSYAESLTQGQDIIITNQRHLYALQQCKQALSDVQVGFTNGISSEFIVMDLRRALQALGEITGAITPDEILGTIFSKFCIGK